MNLVILSGFLATEPEARGDGDKLIVRFSVACNRGYKNAQGNYDADFINCIAFGRTAEMIRNKFHKGSGIEIPQASISTGSYTNKEGKKVYTTDIKVDRVEFPKAKKGDSAADVVATPTESVSSAPVTDTTGFMSIPDGEDTELPFG